MFRFLPLLTLLACTGTTPTGPAPTPSGLEALACGAEEAVVAIDTEDGETLAADLRVGPAADRGAVVLLHMAPTGGFERGNWLPRVRDALAATGVTVLNLDRRGAGDSTGDPDAAAEGPGALLDAEAAVRTLLDPALACGVDPTRIALIGASNGTTAALDYAVEHDPALPDPAALAFLSPGTYTESQNPIDPSTLTLPMLWLYPDTEPYSEAFVADAPSSWTLTEVGSQHGTRMFDGGPLEDTVVEALTTFVSNHVGE